MKVTSLVHFEGPDFGWCAAILAWSMELSQRHRDTEKKDGNSRIGMPRVVQQLRLGMASVRIVGRVISERRSRCRRSRAGTWDICWRTEGSVWTVVVIGGAQP